MICCYSQAVFLAATDFWLKDRWRYIERMIDLWHRFETVARKNPSRILIHHVGVGQLTADELLRAAERIALPAGVKAQKVLVHLPNGAQWLAAFLALHRAGAVIMPLDPATMQEEMLSIIVDTGAAYLFDETGLRATGQTRADVPAGAAFVKLTSGSTGKKRPLYFTAAALIADGEHVVRTMDIRPEDTNLAVIPFGHSYGLGNLVLPLLLQGTACAIPDGFLPACMARACRDTHATILPSVPVHFRALLISDIDIHDFGSVRAFISAGAVLEPTMRKDFRARFGRPLHNFYGTSETGGLAYDGTGSECEGIGQPLCGVDIQQAGEHQLKVRSEALAMNIDTHEGWFTLPDHAVIDEQGCIHLLGRALGFIKIGGRKVFLSEIEKALREIPGVSDVFLKSLEGGTRVAAWVETEMSVAELRAEYLRCNPPWRLPRLLRVLPRLPRTERGKIDHSALPE